MEKQQIILLTLILVLLLIKAIPKIIHDYRRFKMKQSRPYAYFKLTTVDNNSNLDGNKVETDLSFKSYCNQMGLMLFVKQLNDNLKESTDGKIDLIKLLEEVRKAEEEGDLIVQSADEDS